MYSRKARFERTMVLQGDQLYMAVCFWFLVKRDLSSVRYCTVAYTSLTFYKVPEQHGHVYLVGLYKSFFNKLRGKLLIGLRVRV